MQIIERKHSLLTNSYIIVKENLAGWQTEGHCVHSYWFSQTMGFGLNHHRRPMNSPESNVSLSHDDKLFFDGL